MSVQAKSLSDFSLEFTPVSAIYDLSDVARADVDKLLRALVPRLQIVYPVRPPLTLADVTELYLVQHEDSERVHGIACFKVEWAKSANEKSTIVFYGISLLSGEDTEGAELDAAAEFGLRQKLERHSLDFLEGKAEVARIINLSNLKL